MSTQINMEQMSCLLSQIVKAAATSKFKPISFDESEKMYSAESQEYKVIALKDTASIWLTVYKKKESLSKITSLRRFNDGMCFNRRDEDLLMPCIEQLAVLDKIKPI